MIATAEPVCLLPGPVAVSPRVRAAFRRPVVYHRADEFLPLFAAARDGLSAMVGGVPCGLFVGSGTLANDAVAATIAADPRRTNGLILSSGEFGERLVKQARRFGLNPAVLTWDWGRAWQLEGVECAMRRMPTGGWVWGVHTETSTGVRNDLSGLVALARRYGQRVCVDAVSGLGTGPIDLSDVWLASGTSGKAVGSYAGLSFVFARPESLSHLPADAVPTYLDVAAALTTDGPRFTVPSPLVAALATAVEAFATPERRAARYRHVAELGGHVRRRLKEAGIQPLATDTDATPAVVTFAAPDREFVARCAGWCYQVAGQSGYLAARGLAQLAVMGHVGRADVDPLLDRLG